MPTCAVEGCKNSSKKKYKMNSLPCNPVQRNLWMKCIDQQNCTPTKSTAVCEIHFAPEMWEKTRVDGTRKLKWNAVPTIFDNKIVKNFSHLPKIPYERNQNDTNVLIPNNPTIIQVLPAENQLHLQQAQLVISTPASSYVNSKLKPKVAQKKLKPLILSNISSTIINEEAINTDQNKIIISRNSSSSEAKSMNFNHSLSINNINSPDDNEVETDSNQSVLVSATVDEVINLKDSITVNTTNSTRLRTEASDFTESEPITHVTNNSFNVTEIKTSIMPSILIPTTKDSVRSNIQFINLEDHQKCKSGIVNASVITNTENLNRMKNMKSSNQQRAGFVPSRVILNKAEAKKRDDERFERMDKLLLKQLKLNDALRKKLIVLRRKIRRLMKIQDEKEFKLTMFLKQVFSDDQIKVLESRHLNKKSVTAWSDDTMLKAIKLKKACGLRGYEEILNQNLPYPSFKTITKWCMARHIEIP